MTVDKHIKCAHLLPIVFVCALVCSLIASVVCVHSYAHLVSVHTAAAGRSAALKLSASAPGRPLALRVSLALSHRGDSDRTGDS
jgi:hypothetical protein